VRQLLPAPAATADPAAVYALPPGTDRHVRANMVASVDGATAVHGRSRGLAGPADLAVFQTLRRLADLILVGAQTVRAEDYGPPRQVRADGSRPVLAVVSRSLDLDPGSRLFAAGHRPLILTCASAPAGGRSQLAPVADLLEIGDDRVDLVAALDQLADRGYRHVLCEGGPRLLGDLMAAGRLDELDLTVSPQLVAGPSARLLNGPMLPGGPRLRLATLLEDDDFLFARYLVG
jgi:riboflavin biosynthesis pyrimidine reductase